MRDNRRPRNDILPTVVTCIGNGSCYIEKYIEDVISVLDPLFKDYEIVVVTNAPTDDTISKIEALQERYRNIQMYCLARRVGDDVGLLAGVEQAIGDVVITMEAVFDPPEMIPKLIEEFFKGRDIVYGVRTDRMTGVRRGFSYNSLVWFYYKIFKMLSGPDIPAAASAFRLMSRRAVNLFLTNPDRYALFNVVQAFSGLSHNEVPYTRIKRVDAPSRRRYGDAVRRGLRMLMLSSNLPLRMVSFLAVCGAFLDGIYTFYVIIVNLVKRNVVEGWTSLSLQISGLMFMVFIILTILGEYIGRLYINNQSRNAYIIDRERSSVVLSRKESVNVTFGRSVSPVDAEGGKDAGSP